MIFSVLDIDKLHESPVKTDFFPYCQVDCFDEVIPTAGKLLAFQVTDNCWHDHYPFIGKRQTIQFNYITSHEVVDKEMRKHSRSFTIKKLARNFQRSK